MKTAADLLAAIEAAVPQLLRLARELTWNRIPDHCLFILSEIQNEPVDAQQRRRLTKRQNDAKFPQPLAALAPVIGQLYPDFYDVNLYIYRAGWRTTVVDIRYYPKSALSPTYRQTVADREPMLHLKVALPLWLGLTQNPPKFDINWERQPVRTWWYNRWLRFRTWFR